LAATIAGEPHPVKRFPTPEVVNHDHGTEGSISAVDLEPEAALLSARYADDHFQFRFDLLPGLTAVLAAGERKRALRRPKVNRRLGVPIVARSLCWPKFGSNHAFSI